MNLVAKLHQAFVNDFNLKEDVLFNKNAGPLCLYSRKPTILILSIVKFALQKQDVTQKEDKSKIYSIPLKDYEHLFRRCCILKEKLNSPTRERLKMRKCNKDMFLIHLDHLVFFYIKLQEATTIFVITMKRIIALLNQK